MLGDNIFIVYSCRKIILFKVVITAESEWCQQIIKRFMIFNQFDVFKMLQIYEQFTEDRLESVNFI